MAKYYHLTDVGLDDFKPLFTSQALNSFMTDPQILAIGAGDEGKACGVMLLKISEYIIHITYIYVSERFRRRGIAKGFLDYAEDIAFDEEKPLMAMGCAESGADPLYRLFKQRNSFAVNETGEYVYMIPVKELGKIEKHLGAARPTCKIVPFEDLPEEEREDFYQMLSEKGEAYFDPYDRNYLAPLCLAAKVGKKIMAAILITGNKEEMSLRYLYSDYPAVLRDLLKEAADRIDRIPKEIKYLRIATINSESDDLLKIMFPDAGKAGVFYMATMDLSVSYVPERG